MPSSPSDDMETLRSSRDNDVHEVIVTSSESGDNIQFDEDDDESAKSQKPIKVIRKDLI